MSESSSTMRFCLVTLALAGFALFAALNRPDFSGDSVT
jgi:hypothetical protein